MIEGPSESNPSAQSASATVAELWDDRRWGLYDSLTRQSALYADLYKRAIDALSEGTHAALVVAAHCIRDLANGLPDVIADAGALPPYTDVSEPAKALAQAWESYPSELGSVGTPIVSEATSDEYRPLVTVPSPLLEAARKVAEASLTATENGRRRRSALVLGRQEGGRDATVKLFHESVRVFETARHPQRGREINLEEALPRARQALIVIEATLATRIGHFFETVEDLMDVINAANERTASES
jgi:hypothetical protein